MGRVLRAIRRDHLRVLRDRLCTTPAVRRRRVRIRHGPGLLSRPTLRTRARSVITTPTTPIGFVCMPRRWCNTCAERVGPFAARHSSHPPPTATRHAAPCASCVSTGSSAGARTSSDGGDADRSQEGQGKVLLHQRREHRAADAPRRAVEVNASAPLSVVTVRAASWQRMLCVDCAYVGAGVGHAIMQSKRWSNAP